MQGSKFVPIEYYNCAVHEKAFIPQLKWGEKLEKEKNRKLLTQ